MLLLGGSAVYARGDAYEDWFNDDFGSTLGWVTRLDDEGVAVVAGHSVFAMRTHLTQAGVFTVDPPRSMMEIRGSYGDYISDYDLHDITYGTVTNGHGLTEFVLYSDDEPYPDGFPELEHGHIVGVLGITVRNRYGENEQRIFSAYGRPEASAIVLNPTEVTINTDRFDILAEASFRGGVRFLLDQDLDSGRRERFRITGLPREGDTDLVANELYIASDGKLAIYEE